MRLKKAAFLITIFTLALLLACDDEQLDPVNGDEVSSNAINLIQLKSALDNLTFNLFSNNLKNINSGRSKYELHRFSGLAHYVKQAANMGSEEWETCAITAAQQNEDGSITIILNFGSGCEEEDGRSYQGIIVFNISETDSSGTFQIGFENFGKTDQQTDSKSTTLSGWYSGEWVTHPSDQFLYLEKFVESFEVNREGESIEKIIAQGEFLANSFGIVVTKHKFNGSNDSGNVYKGQVVEPLRFNYTCDSTFIYTRGTEVYEVNGISAAIDFGNGSCDNILNLQIDGATIPVEF